MYIGNRKSFEKMLSDFFESNNLDEDRQIIDLCGFHKFNISYLQGILDINKATIILSNIRMNTNDDLGLLESQLLKTFSKSILFRTTPIDLEIEIHKKWAQRSKVLLTSFNTDGVLWMSTEDLVEICFLPLEVINSRLNTAFDLTGERKYSMNDLKNIFEEDIGEHIDLPLLNEDIVLNILLKNGMSSEQAKWLIKYQIESSDPKIKRNDNVQKILKRKPRKPNFKLNILGG
ncbi:hypothetical protein [Staphylococcus pseudintermedius]|uniref:hypothetical protein n=1 Tax=Staphylococcus pseudintermedius TaxID=283734 RepID=UPI0035C09151